MTVQDYCQLGGHILCLNDKHQHTGEEGGYNYGVFLQEVPGGGQYVYKLSDTDLYFDTGLGGIDWKRVDEVAHIHRTLGDAGLAPQLYAYSARNADLVLIKDFFQQQTGLVIDDRFLTQGAVFVMGYVANTWNFKKRFDTPPDASLLDVAHLARRIRQMEHTLNELGIYADDTQYFIDTEGNVYLGDLDLYSYSSRRNDFSSDILELERKIGLAL